MMHFEELWEKCENFHKDNTADETVSDILNEFLMKLNLFASISAKSEISSEDIEKAKSRLFGEILLSLTAISLKENINVYDALQIALTQRSISHYSEKYSK